MRKVDLRTELASSRWKRWRDYIREGKSEMVVAEFTRYIKFSDPCFGDLRLHEDALKELGVLKLRPKRLK
jgi:hypothetical protein